MTFAVKGEDGGGQSDDKTLSVEERGPAVSTVFRGIKPTSSCGFSAGSGLGLDGVPVREAQVNDVPWSWTQLLYVQVSPLGGKLETKNKGKCLKMG